MTLKNNRTSLLSNIKLCASFHHHMWIQTWVTIRKRLNGIMTSVTLTFDPWPWLFAWTSRLSLAGFAFTASPNGKDVKLTPLDVKIFDSQVPTVASNYLQGPHRESPKAMSKLSDTLIESHLGQRRYQSQITIIFNQLHIVSHSWSGISQEKYIFNHTH